jgi:hypothetical protein
MQAAAARRKGPDVSPPLSTENARSAPAAAAKTTLAAETWFGRTPRAASRRASERDHRLSRVFRGRLAAAVKVSSPGKRRG